VTTQYEVLRTAAFGSGLPLEARSGLALILRQGMWAWAKAAAAMRRPPHPKHSPLRRSTAGDERRALVHIFAALAMGSTGPRIHERIA
jgi:hypothetical protein